jgi:hypothetical protein
MRKIQAVAGVALALLLVVGVALSAAAVPTNHAYGSFVGINYSFINANETVQTADDDPNPLFGAPILAANQLIFTPPSFDADSANGNGGAGLGALDMSHSTFNTTITSNTPGIFVDLISIDEAGDIILTAFPPGSGTGATGVVATMSGTVTILAALDTSVIGEIITFGGAGGDFASTFTPGPQTNQLFVGLQPAGTFSWTGSVDIDIASLFAGAGVTSVALQFNNSLMANSEPGTTALIQKKAVSGPKITVVPEPATGALVACGLIALAARSRVRRA